MDEIASKELFPFSYPTRCVYRPDYRPDALRSESPYFYCSLLLSFFEITMQ